MTRALIAALAACSTGSSNPVTEVVAPSDAAIDATLDAAIPALPMPEPRPSLLGDELAQELRTTGAVIHRIEGHVTVIEDDELRQLSRQRAMAVAQEVGRLLVDPRRSQPRCSPRGNAFVCSQLMRGSTPASERERRLLFLVYCRTDSWRLHTIMLGFSSLFSRDLLRDPQQSACP